MVVVWTIIVVPATLTIMVERTEQGDSLIMVVGVGQLEVVNTGLLRELEVGVVDWEVVEVVEEEEVEEEDRTHLQVLREVEDLEPPEISTGGVHLPLRLMKHQLLQSGAHTGILHRVLLVSACM